MNILISVEVSDHDALLSSILNKSGHIKNSISLENDVLLSPQFTTIKKKKAVGAVDILNFMLSIPVGIATGVAANALYSWFVKNKIPKVKIKKTEITVKNENEQTISLIIKTLTKE